MGSGFLQWVGCLIKSRVHILQFHIYLFRFVSFLITNDVEHLMFMQIYDFMLEARRYSVSNPLK